MTPPAPDVEPVGFAATDGPQATLTRRRRPAWLALAVILAVLGIGGPAWFVFEQTRNAPGRDEAVASGTIAALGAEPQPLRFRGEGHHTVWLDAAGILRSNRRETVVAATNCLAVPENGDPVSFRGARQGASVTIGDRSTVGTFEMVPGTVELSCRLLPFGRYGNRLLLSDERSFFVTPGRPGVGFLPWVGLFGGILCLICAAVAFGRYRTGFLRPRIPESVTV